MGQVTSWTVTSGVVLAFSLLWTVQLSTSCPHKCVCHTREVLNITSITCAQGNLTTVPKNLSQEVTHLDLSGNNISLLGSALSPLNLLEDLNISFNSIEYLNTSVFDTLFNLQTLDLSQNAISTIQPKVFADLASIQEVNLANNNLTFVDNEIFFGLQKLERLYLYFNKISVVENSTFLYMKELVVIDLSYNNLTELQSSTFTGLTSLEELNLQHNNIAYIEDGTFTSLTSLKYLDLSYNALSFIRKFTFSSMPNLISLSLSGNIIGDMMQDFMGSSDQLQVLTMDENKFTNISIPLFTGLEKLENLSLSKMPSLTNIAFNAFHGLPSLKSLDLSHNPSLSLLHPHLLDQLPELASTDLSYNNLSTLSQLTFHNNLKLQIAHLEGNYFLCNCGLAWLANSITQNSTVYSKHLMCLSESTNQPVSLYGATNLTTLCNEIPQVNATSVLYFAIGSSALLTCDFEPDHHTVVIWSTPRHLTLTYHAFHPDVTAHLLTEEDTFRNSSYHSTHYWHNSSSYYSSLRSYKDRIVLLNNGSLYIDYVLRSDNGPYQCLVMNANYNSSAQILVKLDYGVLFNVKIMSIVVGLSAALSMFLLNLIFSIIGAIARRLVNKRRREAIRKLLENLDTYKTSQFARLRENYNGQLSRIRDHYHNQFHRLSDNYHSQMKRVRRGCSHQVDRIRDNYTIQVGRLRNYSSHQIEQIREMYNNQLLKIRDYGSLQMVRIHEKYKLQQQHVIKLLETMNLDNCKTVIETECLRTESMIFDVDILKDAEHTPLSPLSGSDSEYMTASSSENSSQDSLRLSPSPEEKDFVVDTVTQELAPSVMEVVEADPEHENVSFVIDLEPEEGNGEESKVKESVV